MSRRRTKKTRLIYCEGAQDKAFLDCIKGWYGGDIYSVDVKRGAGGNQVHLVQEAYKVGSAYGQVYVKLDGDRERAEMDEADELAVKLKIIILRSTPATENLLMSILDPNKSISSWSTKRLKRYFEKVHIPEAKRTDSRVYKALFTKEILDEARGRVEELEAIVGLF